MTDIMDRIASLFARGGAAVRPPPGPLPSPALSLRTTSNMPSLISNTPRLDSYNELMSSGS
jgi:hypothetical protein